MNKHVKKPYVVNNDNNSAGCKTSIGIH